jgi:serine/threonine protein kinase
MILRGFLEQVDRIVKAMEAISAALNLLGDTLGRYALMIAETLFQDCKATFKEIEAHIGKIQRRPVEAERRVASSLRNLKELQGRLNSTGSKLSLILSPLALNAALSRRKNEWTRHIANVEDLLVFDNGSSIPRELPTLDLFPPVPNWLSPSASNLRSWLFDSLLNTCKRLECLHKTTELGVQSYSAHLDLKPANILISDSGRTTITDFGRSLTSCLIQPPKALPYGDNFASEEPWSGYVDLYLIAYSKALHGPMIKRCTDRESLDLDFQKDDHAALDLKWLKQMGLEPGALELIETTAHSFNQLPSSTRGLLYVLTYLDPQKLSGYLMESASLATWPQCVTDASNHGVSEMLLRLINESLDRYARGVAGAMKDHIIEIDSDIDNVKSKIPTIYSSRQVPTTELHKTEYPLVNDRRIIQSSSGGIETRSEVTEFAGHLAPDEPFAKHHAVQLIDGSMMGIPHHEVVRQERETSLKKSIFDATVSGDLELLETLISEGSRSTQQSPWHQRTGNLKNLPLLDIQSLEDLLQLVEEQKLGSAATTILSAAVRFYRQDRLKTSNHNEEAGDDGGKKEPVLGGNSLEQEYPTIAGSPMGRVLDVSRPRSSPIGR